MSAPRPPQLGLPALFVRFLRFGALAWGGPVAQIAMLRRELVEDEAWISSERFNRTLAVYQVLPGPEAHELTVYFGQLARGRIGGFLAGLAFMLPGFVLMLGLAWIYVTVGVASPAVAALFAGAQAAVLALIVRAVHRIAGHTITGIWLPAIALLVVLSTLAGVHFAACLAIAGTTHLLVTRGHRVAGLLLLVALAVLALFVGFADPPSNPTTGSDPPAAALTTSAEPATLFASGLKAGLLSFGGAYSALPILEADATGAGWLERAVLLDGMALAGVLPAPLIIFATFVGYAAGGPAGALAMTAGIFLPAFGLTLLGHRWLERLVEHRAAHAFLDGVTAGVVGLIAAVAIRFAPSVLTSVIAAIIFVAALLALYRWRAGWIVAVVVLAGAGASLGWFALTVR